MKMRKLYNMALSGVLLLLSAASLTSCNNANDWEVDSAYDRLFHTTSFAVTPFDTKAAISFAKMPNTDYYVVELSKDSLTNDMEMGSSSTSIVDSAITTSPDTIYDLDSSTKYYIRIKCRNKEGKGSNWKYPDSKYSFTTKSEQIITSVVPASTKVTVNWTAGLKVNAAYIYKDNDSTKTDITAADVAAGTITIPGLTANTSYKVALYNGTVKRGYYSFKTTEAYPEDYQVMTIAAGDDLNAKLAAATSSNVVVNFAQGTTYSFPLTDGTVAATSTVIPDNIKSVIFWGAAGDTKPTFIAKGLNATSDKTLIRFYNLNIQNLKNDADYVINESAGVNIGSIEFEKCTISTTRGIIRSQGTNSGSMSTIKINDCIISDIGSYGLINTKGQTNLGITSISMTNSTVSGLNAGAVINMQQNNTAITIDHCTFYNCVQTTKSFIDVNKLTTVSPVISNTIIGPYYGSDGTGTIKACSVKGQFAATNVFFTSDLTWTSGYEMGTSTDVSSTTLWTDPANLNFIIQPLYKASFQSYGDPRWISE